MSGKVRRNTQNPLPSLHHSSLIKILVCHELEQRKDTWIAFLNCNYFGFSNQLAEVVPKINSSQENDEEERLFDEDNHPLSDWLQEKMQQKLMQKQGGDEIVGIKFNSKNRRG